MAEQRIRSLDGLRAIAIILVLLYHLTPGHDSNRGLESILFKIADLGWSGVDLFFVLSGYLISSILIVHRERGRPLSHFLMRRLLRIVPLYYLALLLVFLVTPLLLRWYEPPPLEIQIRYLLYISNFFSARLPLNDYFQLGHFWSLAVEVQFYLMWPLILYYLPPTTSKWAAVSLLLLAVLVRGVAVFQGADPNTTFGWTPFRLDGLLAGSLVAILIHESDFYLHRRWLVWGVALASGVFLALLTWRGYGSSMWKPEYPWLRILLPFTLSLFFASVLTISLHKGVVATGLSTALFAPIARYSYGIYVIHFLLLPLFERFFHPTILADRLNSVDASIYVYFFLASSMSYFLAKASFHGLEQHFLKLKAKY